MTTGVVHEGTARGATVTDGESVDVEWYGLIVDEWGGPAAALDGHRRS